MRAGMLEEKHEREIKEQARQGELETKEQAKIRALQQEIRSPMFELVPAETEVIDGERKVSGSAREDGQDMETRGPS